MSSVETYRSKSVIFDSTGEGINFFTHYFENRKGKIENLNVWVC